ncbi:BMP-binding endothelial regulator protein [Apis laboriosa]|uniref:BMP-binding endothelial regulator protein n=1 Tax=Apis laboriosa TaxID=183418 RepID=UPI001CC7B192|nr:BMP-binding endothelial regulator protein [Apis laboriosa]XP_043798668.1 BMP-binding endothelial regulator protein [Apis laboriosa]XP_043798669.1 BMP-binding endothelial regulator protein [Apis laboriosa]
MLSMARIRMRRLSSKPLILVLALALISSIRHCHGISESIIGSRETCDVEGEDFTVDKIPNTRCFNCLCKNGFVECRKQQCPSIEGCYTLLEPREDECCHRCKGCTRNGVHHGSETEWTEGNDPCRIFACKAGVITESRLHCYTPCSDPIPPPPGQCCPVCAGCHVNGQMVTADRSVTTTEDPCVTCRCNGARLTCAKQACPVLHCLGSRIVHDPGECCPRCKGSGRYLSPPKGACTLGTSVYNSGNQFYLDQCTRCTCSNSTVSCVRETCPVHDCPAEHQIALPGRCCPQCPEVEEVRPSCTYAGKTYGDGESWKLDSCKACACMQGKVRCAMPMCPPLNVPCPPNSRLEHPEGQCCPHCVESDGVCTVFGDPHYRTFDGKFYSFKGACKYQLASDCTGHTFSIRVTNDARSTRFSAWTKTIAIKVGDSKVNLGQKMRVKVNGKKVDLPYRVVNRLDVNRTLDGIIVSTHIGIKVLWDGISFLEVSAPTSYRGRLCGLCGNFNSLPKDDFTNRRGKLLQDPQPFGQSWLVGAKKSCVRPKSVANVDRARRCRGRKDHRLCNRLRSQIFDACHKKVNPTMYYKACLQDMCECPTENCYCESFTAYVHECKRLGIQLPHWRKSTRCRTGWDQFSGSGASLGLGFP